MQKGAIMLDPINNPVHRIRLTCGDTDMPYWLEDSMYEYALSVANGNEKAATKQCAQYILAALSRNAHEKLVQIEIYGREYFENYREFIMTVIRNPASGAVAPIPYGGAVPRASGDEPLIVMMEKAEKNCSPRQRG